MKDWREFKSILDAMPVIDTHEHYRGKIKEEKDIFLLALGWYARGDMANAAGSEELLAQQLFDSAIPFEKRCETFLSLYEKIKFTGYADEMRRAMKISWGVGIDREGFYELKDRICERTQEFHDGLIEKANIKAAVCDLIFERFDMFTVLNEDSKDYVDWARFTISAQDWHSFKSRGAMQAIADKMTGGRQIVSLDDYEAAMETCVKRCVEKGVFVAFKDQSAYKRAIDYKNPTKHEAEAVFNKLMHDPRYTAGTDEVRPLDDYLYHRIVRLAGKYDIPFQHHTGALAGLYHDVRGANAVHLTPVIEMYPHVTFDLFHGNWPYMGEYLYLGKSYPNVVLDLCWAQMIDPDYAIELMRRMVLTVPVSHVMVYGGDTEYAEHQVGALDQARENVARALCSLIDDGKLDDRAAEKIARDWLFNNPNKIFKLNL